ncbi:MAG: sulfatase [bacterium]
MMMTHSPEITRRDFVSQGMKFALGAAAFHAAPFALAQGEDKPLNFICILIDDLGWTDLGSFGSDYYKTPNIDRLASGGMKFTNAYSSCTVCSPTRASIMTGKYPARLHITDWIAGHRRPYARLRVPEFRQQLPLEEITIAEALKKKDYATAHQGKWHLGEEPYYPDRQGFDINFGGTDRGQPPSYFHPYNIHTIEGGEEGEYLTDRLADEAVDFVQQNRDHPFFLYWAHFAVHTPIQAKKELIAEYERTSNPDAPHHRADYAAMIHSLDEAVGRLLDTLEERSLLERTVIFFMSDNGGLMRVTSNQPLRAGKGSAYEGGVRTPMIVHWQGFIEPGSVCDVPVISMDFYPTVLELAGIKPEPDQVIDGVSLVPLLKQSGRLENRPLFWHYPHYHPGGATPYSAVRLGDYKLIEFLEDRRLELYNIAEDIGEQNDLSGQMREKTLELHRLLRDWRQQVNAQMPEINPDYDPEYENKSN